MNDFPLFVFFPIDMIVVAILGFFISFWLISLFLPLLVSIFLGGAIGVFLFFQYKRYKKEVAPGFIFHILYVLGFVSMNPHSTDEEMLEMDVDGFFPEGYETEFSD
ncbi:type IV conjugative transfer system protein TraL [Patescibacteria group bacterium]|nr:type IV conjugative transfer system protein TraL [Patescibacteria group bacterium]